MLRYWKIAPLALLLGVAGCGFDRHSSAGFRLPSDGDVERGKAAFVSLDCNRCHQVSGTDLPRPTVDPAVPVVLGGPVSAPVTDGYLVTSIINPSYELALYPPNSISVHGHSRMPEYADRVTVRQLTDVVAFLQSRYIVEPRMPRYRAY